MRNTHNKKPEVYAVIKRYLVEYAPEIEEKATKMHKDIIGGDKLRHEFLNKVKKDHTQIVREIGTHLGENAIEKNIAFFTKLGEVLARKSVQYELRMQEALNGITFLKQALWMKLEKAGILGDLGAKELYTLNQIVGMYIDTLSSQLAFVYHDELIKERDRERLRLEFGQKAGRIGTYEWNILTGRSVWTKEFEALYGFPHGGYKAGNTKAWLTYVHPDDRKRVMEETKRAIKNRSELISEFRVIWPDKSIHYLMNRAQIIRNAKGKAIQLNGVNIDITERKIVENNLTYLSEASKILASSLDFKTTLTNVATLAVPIIADWCSVTMKNGEALEGLAIAHVDPKKVKWAKELQKKSPLDPNAKTGVPQVIRTGKSQLFTKVTDDMLVASAKSNEELSLLRKLQMSSIMIVPLLSHGKAIGAMTFIAAESGRHYTESDLAMAEEVTSRMALAIENARLYKDAQTVDEVQKKLAAIVESSDDAIISKSIEGIITSWNKGAERLYGYKPEEVIGKPVSILMPPDKKDDFPMIMKQLQQGKKIEHYETRRKAKDGKIFDVAITVSPLRNKEGKIIGASKIARNITDRKQTEEKGRFLEHASRILGSSIDYETTLKNLGRLIVPYLADYCRIVVIDEEQQVKEIAINHANPKKLPLVRKLYNVYKDEPTTTYGVGTILEGGKVERLSQITPEMLNSTSERVRAVIRELELTSYMGVPMKVGNKIVGAITFSSTRSDRLYTREDQDLAEELARRAALAIENSRLFAESQKAVALRDEFISVASHELKTPVTSLKMYTQGLQKQFERTSEDEPLRYLRRMNNQIEKMTTLISDLLNVSRMQLGKLDFSMEAFDLHEVVDDVIDSIKPTTQKHTIVVSGTINKKVWGDKERIGQVMTNLLTNAIKYSPKANKVIVELTPEKSEAVVTVRDFGIGIEKEHQNRIFERFYRVTSPEEKTFPGLGIGLYLSHEIIDRHGGKMNVVSNKGKGSQFSFTIPYSK